MDSGISPTTRCRKRNVLKVLIAAKILGYTLQWREGRWCCQTKIERVLGKKNSESKKEREWLHSTDQVTCGWVYSGALSLLLYWAVSPFLMLQLHCAMAKGTAQMPSHLTTCFHHPTTSLHCNLHISVPHHYHHSHPEPKPWSLNHKPLNPKP